MKVSVIVCTKDRISDLIKFYNSLSYQSDLPDEFIIIDSSQIPISQDVLFKENIISKSKIPIKYLHTKPGLTYQRNIGVAQATGDLIYFFDDDIILEKSFLQEMNSTFVSSPEYAAGMGTLTNYKNSMTVSEITKLYLKRLFLLSHPYGTGKFYKSGFASIPLGQPCFLQTEMLSGGLTGYRKEIFSNLKFDDNVTGYSYMEDEDFSKRLSFKNKSFYNPKAKCFHNHTAGGRGSVIENRKMLLVNHRYFFKKNFNSYTGCKAIPHYWSILGLFVTNPNFKSWRGLYLGLFVNLKLK